SLSSQIKHSPGNPGRFILLLWTAINRCRSVLLMSAER
ncbi:hypothetical protein ACQ3JK_004208, partial [Escherichia coli]